MVQYRHFFQGDGAATRFDVRVADFHTLEHDGAGRREEVQNALARSSYDVFSSLRQFRIIQIDHSLSRFDEQVVVRQAKIPQCQSTLHLTVHVRTNHHTRHANLRLIAHRVHHTSDLPRHVLSTSHTHSTHTHMHQKRLDHPHVLHVQPARVLPKHKAFHLQRPRELRAAVVGAALHVQHHLLQQLADPRPMERVRGKSE